MSIFCPYLPVCMLSPPQDCLCRWCTSSDGHSHHSDRTPGSESKEICFSMLSSSPDCLCRWYTGSDGHSRHSGRTPGSESKEIGISMLSSSPDCLCRWYTGSDGHSHHSGRTPGSERISIDYFLTSTTPTFEIQNTRKLDYLHQNVSDHYPINMTLIVSNESCEITSKNNLKVDNCTRIVWDKVDKDMYTAIVNDSMDNIVLDLESEIGIETTIHNIQNVLVKASEVSRGKTRKRKSKPKLKVWNDNIRNALATSKQAHHMYKVQKQNDTLSQEAIENRKKAKKTLRSAIRKEQARISIENREKTLEARTQNTKLFYRLIKQQRGLSYNHITELTVNDETFKGENIIDGWQKHFMSLATPTDNVSNFDSKYHLQVHRDITVIHDICAEEQGEMCETNVEEVTTAIKRLNSGKSPDAYGVTSEHVIYGGHKLVVILVNLFNAILGLETVPDSLKIGTLTPVFKKKGQKSESRNYRGITVLPILGKLLELIIRNRLRDIIDPKQNGLQRGFTSSSSPLNCALIIEEFIRENLDKRINTYIALLDAKAAFDVVDHESLFRKLYNAGVNGKLWNIIYNLHSNAVSAVKWEGGLSKTFPVEQGVRQGGILSADLYKLYINDLLDRMVQSGAGGHIGDIPCNAPTCADDMTTLSETENELQTLCNVAYDYSCMERYLLQPTKSVVLPVQNGTKANRQPVTHSWTLGNDKMPVVNEATHVGIRRSQKPSPEASIQENITKARKTLYGLMASSLHGTNGLDPTTCIHLLKVYVLPVLLYGLEVQIPNEKACIPLDLMLKKTLKHILSLPTNTADPAPFILTGIIPAEGLIHIKALTFFGNICRLPADSIERKLAERQLSIKCENSNSWFIAVKQLLVRYNLPCAFNILSDTPKKDPWNRLVSTHVNKYWAERIVASAELYSTLQHFSVLDYRPGCLHPTVLTNIPCTMEITRIAVKLKILTGTYILQSNRAAFNKHQVDPTCVLCGQSSETLDHFILRCVELEDVRTSVLLDLSTYFYDICGIHFNTLSVDEQLQIIIDIGKSQVYQNCAELATLYVRMNIERLCRRLCHKLHEQRYYLISKLPVRKRDGL